MLDLLELLLIEDLVLETTLHYVLANFFDALYKETLKLVLVSNIGHLLKLKLLMPSLLGAELCRQLSNSVCIVGLQGLDVADDLFFNILLLHLRPGNKLHELFELDVLSLDVSVV